jgi:hypothetical protein
MSKYLNFYPLAPQIQFSPVTTVHLVSKNANLVFLQFPNVTRVNQDFI